MENEQIANEFLSYIGDNYNKLLSGFQKSSYKKDLDDDVFHDSIMKVYNSIIKNGFKFQQGVFSGKSFENYLFIVCGNQVIGGKRESSKMEKVDVESDYQFDWLCKDNSDYSYEMENQFNSEIEKISEDLLVDEMLCYCKKRHSQLDCGIFEFYFRSGLGYRPLAEITGFSFRTIFVKINKIKKDLIENFSHKKLSHRVKIKK